ncbi:MAG: FAD-binding oxidoreductase [Pseudomonadota bacterium]|nr:FAD-binding oxidoreductase [Pseudomonadota bacterium]
MSDLPVHATYVIIGAGIHGLSTAMHLAQRLEAQGTRIGLERGATRIVILDKTGIGAGASGIACGVIRNNYYQPAMRELMAHSVSVWESDPEAYSYHPVGYMQISPEVMHAQVNTIYEQQKAIGYESVFVEGVDECMQYMRGVFRDWQAQNITSVLHEKRGGYANNQASLEGLSRKVRALGVEIVEGVTVTGLRPDNVGAIEIVETSAGAIRCEQVVVAVGPWINSIWNMLALPKTVSIRGRDGAMHDDVSMWHYMALQEGTLGVDPNYQKMNDGRMPPVIHVDTDAPLYSDRNGALITDQLWGLYYKPDFHFGGVQGGAMPAAVERAADDVRVDPYGTKSPEFVVTDNFADMWTSALAFCQKRFEGQHGAYRNEPSGGIGCFTPDSFPVFDRFRENVYVIADSNHGYKMIGVGELVADELLGRPRKLLEPFRFSRYAEGKLHPTSNSPFPWS